MTKIYSLPEEVQSSPELQTALRVAEAFVQTNYVRFFQLLRNRASYLQACLMHRVRCQRNGGPWSADGLWAC